MCAEKTDWEKAAEFHGHICPGLAMGYRAAIAGMRLLSARRAPDEEIVAIVENDACGVDAVQVITGCTFGKGNLIFHDHGKQVFTFACRQSGKAVRVSVNRLSSEQSEEARLLRQRVFGGTASPDDRERFQESQAARAKAVLEAPEDTLLNITEIILKMPPQARIFNSVRCAFCGEWVMEPRTHVRDGKMACIPCSERYPARL